MEIINLFTLKIEFGNLKSSNLITLNRYDIYVLNSDCIDLGQHAYISVQYAAIFSGDITWSQSPSGLKPRYRGRAKLQNSRCLLFETDSNAYVSHLLATFQHTNYQTEVHKCHRSRHCTQSSCPHDVLSPFYSIKANSRVSCISNKQPCPCVCPAVPVEAAGSPSRHERAACQSVRAA